MPFEDRIFLEMKSAVPGIAVTVLDCTTKPYGDTKPSRLRCESMDARNKQAALRRSRYPRAAPRLMTIDDKFISNVVVNMCHDVASMRQKKQVRILSCVPGLWWLACRTSRKDLCFTVRGSCSSSTRLRP